MIKNKLPSKLIKERLSKIEESAPSDKPFIVFIEKGQKKNEWNVTEQYETLNKKTRSIKHVITDIDHYMKINENIPVLVDYKIDDNNVYLIDTGNDKEAGKKILKIIDENGWNIKGIINTHSNADHIGGNKIIQDRTNCIIFAYNIEKSFTEFPILESSFLYGGYPFKDIRNTLIASLLLNSLINSNLSLTFVFPVNFK